MEAGVGEGKRVKVVFDDETWKVLTDVAQISDRDPGQVIADGLNKMNFITEELNNGSRYLISRRMGWWGAITREVLFPW